MTREPTRLPAKRNASINPMTSGSANSGYRSMCKACEQSIHGEPAIWSRNPTGLIHATCAKEDPR